MYAPLVCIITMHLFASISSAAVKSWMRLSSSRECFACAIGLGSIHGSIACAISHLGMEMWVIQLACHPSVHHWSTAVHCYLVGATTRLMSPSPRTRRRSQYGQPVVSSRISSPSVLVRMPSDGGLQQQLSQTPNSPGRIPLCPGPALPSIQCQLLPCPALIALPFCLRDMNARPASTAGLT
jgi:hypothetical protein